MGILFISNESGIGCAGWVIRGITQATAQVLLEMGNKELAEWLMSEESPVTLFNMLDVRELIQKNQEEFKNCLVEAYSRLKEGGVESWGGQPEFWDGYIGLFRDLASQIENIEKGIKPKKLPNLSGISEYTGTKSGPGWNENA